MSVDLTGYLYQPLHPDMTFEDIEGATYAYDTGTHWMFAHCSPGEHTAFARDARAFAFDAFMPALVKANWTLGRGGVDAAEALHTARALREFAEQTAAKAFDTARFKTLGHWHRDPHADHKRDIAVGALKTVLTAWRSGSRTADLARVDSTIGDIRRELEKNFVHQWRHEHARELAATGHDPVDGREHCYTLSATADAITGDANLPDPDWHFDAFPGQGIVKGEQTYHDRAPTATESLPFVIRFHRPVPTPAPNRGVSIGSVEWVQDEAYRAG